MALETSCLEKVPKFRWLNAYKKSEFITESKYIFQFWPSQNFPDWIKWAFTKCSVRSRSHSTGTPWFLYLPPALRFWVQKDSSTLKFFKIHFVSGSWKSTSATDSDLIRVKLSMPYLFINIKKKSYIVILLVQLLSIRCSKTEYCVVCKGVQISCLNWDKR